MICPVGIERRDWVIGWIELHALDRVVKIDLVPLAHHHGIFRGPLRIFDMGEGGIGVRVCGHEDLAGDYD